MNVNMDYYKTFYYVAKLGSITEAAQVLYNNQPNVTRIIKKLEQELECQLFERNHRGVNLTEEGKVLYNRMHVVMKEMELAMQDIDDMKKVEKGKVLVATTEIALHGILLSTLKKYKKLYPHIQLSVTNQTTKEALESIRRGEADFALVTGITSESAEFDILPLKSFREIAICSEAYKELLQHKVSLERLSKYPIIALNDNTVHYQFYKQLFEKYGLQFIVDIDAASIDQILPMVAYDLGIGFVPEFFYDEVSNYSNIRKIDLEELIPERGIFLVKHKGIASSIAAKKLEELFLLS